MKKILRKIAVFMLTVAMAVNGVMTAFAEQTYSDIWKEGEGGVWYAYNKGGEQISNAWLCDDAVTSNGRNVWYLMGRDGKMISAGLVQDGTGILFTTAEELRKDIFG